MEQISVEGIQINVTRKNIKNMYLSILPHKIVAAIPLRATDHAVQYFIHSKLKWIKKHWNSFVIEKEVVKPKFVTGEFHYYLGRQYVLNIIYQKGNNKVLIQEDSTLALYVSKYGGFAYYEKILHKWYGQKMIEAITPLIFRWQEIMGIRALEWRVKKMKTRWGTCNIEKRRIWLNLELIKKPEHCIEYIIVHELVHLLERKHNQRFYSYMNQFMPQWKEYKKELDNIRAIEK